MFGRSSVVGGFHRADSLLAIEEASEMQEDFARGSSSTLPSAAGRFRESRPL